MSVEPRSRTGASVVWLLLGGLVLLLGGQLLGGAAGPEAEIVTQLKVLEREGFDSPLSFGTLRSSKLQFQRLSVTFEGDGGRAYVTGTLDFTGDVRRHDGGLTTVSSLGLERMTFTPMHGDWDFEGPVSPRLGSILELLEARRTRDQANAFESTQLQNADLAAEAWFIRSERDLVLISEDRRLRGSEPDRPVDERQTRRLTLDETDGGFQLRDDP